MDFGAKKSRAEALLFKHTGNNCYKEKSHSKALKCYTMAIMLCPHSIKDQRQFLLESMEVLKASSPSKHAVAEKLYFTANGAVMDTPTEEDHAFKQQLVMMLSPELVAQASAAAPGQGESDPLLAQSFGNRSAALYEMKCYKDCLSDIERALEHGFPADSAHKLVSRRERCKAALLREDEEKPPTGDVVASPPFQNINAFQSDAISVVSTPGLGRHMTAARDIAAGEVILSEESYVSVLNSKFRDTHCCYCLKESSNSIIPCVLCTFEGYCSAECRLQAWVKYHWLECKVTPRWRKDAEWMEIMCLRVVAAADPADILKASKGLEVAGEYGFICKLIAHEEKSHSRHKSLLTAAALNLNLCFGEEIRSMCLGVDGSGEPLEEMALKKLFYHHLLQLRCNSHSVSDLQECLPKEVVTDGDSGELLVESISSVSFGTVLLPTASLMNHSCLPNAMFRFEGSRVFVCVTEPLKKGQEINNCYIPGAGRMKTAMRRKELQKKYFFECSCLRCLGTDPELSLKEAAMDGLACLRCGTGALTEERGYACCHCKATLSDADLQEMLQKKEEADLMFTAATDGGSVVDLKLLLKCQKLRTSILHKHNLTLALTYDRIAEQYALQGKCEVASRFLKRSCEAVGAIFGKQSIEYGNEMHKLASVCCHSGDLKKALKAAEKAKNILAMYYSPTYPCGQAMDKMVKTLRESLQVQTP